MALEALGDTELQTTITISGEVAQTQTFDQLADATYEIDVSSSPTVSPYPIDADGTDNLGFENSDGFKTYVALRGSSATVTFSGNLSATVDGESTDPAHDIVIDGQNYGNSATNVTVNNVAGLDINANGQDITFNYDWEISQSVSSDVSINSVTQSQ